MGIQRKITEIGGSFHLFIDTLTSGYQGRSTLRDPRFLPHSILDGLLVFFIFFVFFSPAIVPLMLAGQLPEQRELLTAIGLVASSIYLAIIIGVIIILIPIGIVQAVKSHKRRTAYAKHRTKQR